MRYWSFGYPDEKNKDVIETFSEDDIMKTYWPYWYGRMCDKFGKDHVDAHYCKEDCIQDWITVHWAWESK